MFHNIPLEFHISTVICYLYHALDVVNNNKSCERIKMLLNIFRVCQVLQTLKGYSFYPLSDFIVLC